ncbi:Coatomer subunit beta-2 [Frankliniella fusca]|uniref:Coatomer subunit beta-2 n=1 Tax=Frankliniella fusca TaxID=407009 RepID=A0AAE1GQU7_9NEOP|nr:Coatomer subunit beta-2 [Frankliniella fusca]
MTAPPAPPVLRVVLAAAPAHRRPTLQQPRDLLHHVHLQLLPGLTRLDPQEQVQDPVQDPVQEPRQPRRRDSRPPRHGREVAGVLGALGGRVGATAPAPAAR